MRWASKIFVAAVAVVAADNAEGKSGSERRRLVIDGRPSDPLSKVNNFYQASVKMSNVSEPLKFHHVCGATLVSAEWAITSADCVTNKMTCDETGKCTAVSPDLVQVANFPAVEARCVQKLTAKQIILHPAYNSLYHENNIALIKVTEPFLVGNSTDKCFDSRFIPDLDGSDLDGKSALTPINVPPGEKYSGLDLTFTGMGALYEYEKTYTCATATEKHPAPPDTVPPKEWFGKYPISYSKTDISVAANLPNVTFDVSCVLTANKTATQASGLPGYNATTKATDAYYPDTLQIIDQPLVMPEVCKEKWNMGYRHGDGKPDDGIWVPYDFTKVGCAGYLAGGKAPCIKDEGGAYVVKRNASADHGNGAYNDPKALLVGILSYRSNEDDNSTVCGSPDQVGFFTRIVRMHLAQLVALAPDCTCLPSRSHAACQLTL
jgi:hypothetical protein